MGNLESSLFRDLQIHDVHKSEYNKFWDIAAAKIYEKTAQDDQRHATASRVVVNTALTISAPDQKNWKAGLTAKEMSSRSFFKLYIWLKRCYNRFSTKFHGSIFCLIYD